MTWIKTHWFGLITGIFIFVCLILFILVLLSPRQDEQKRGFIPCTEMMAETMLDCNNGVGCMLKAVLSNSWCDAKVIGCGLKNWATGKQSAPWSNYIFIPVLPPEESFDDIAREEYLKNNPAFAEEMKQLQQLSEEIENETAMPAEVSPGEHPLPVQPDNIPAEPSGLGSE